MPDRINFNKENIGKLLAKHDGTRRAVHDTKQPGLIIELRKSGAASFYLYRRIDGRPARIRIGAVDAVTVEQARTKAASLIGEIAKGENPAAARRAARVEHTLGALFDWWLDNHAKPRLRSWRESERLFNKHLKHWRNLRLSNIARQDVQALHAKLGKDNGKYLANRVLSLLKLLYNKADGIGYQGRNPAARIERFAEVERERFLQPDEVPRFFRALEVEPPVFADFFTLLLLTGARRSNVQSLRWDDLNLQARTWSVAGEQSKNGKPMVVHLPVKAVEILLLRYSDRDESGYVFPSNSKSGYLAEPNKAWTRIIERAGLKDIRPHDLRRTLGSWLASAGVSLPMIGAALGHKSTRSTHVYARLMAEPVALAVGNAAVALLEAGEAKPEAKPKKGKTR